MAPESCWDLNPGLFGSEARVPLKKLLFWCCKDCWECKQNCTLKESSASGCAPIFCVS